MEEETLVSRRSKRSTAGNRMQIALAEIAAEDLSKEDAEEDKDFVVETYEEDAFESDFASTEEEETAAAEQDPVDNEEKQARKAAKSRLERATAAAHARQKITFNPTTASSGSPASTLASTSKTKPKGKRRVSLGFAINAQTGEVITENTEDKGDHIAEAEAEEGDGTVLRTRKRSSQRKTTIQNTSDTVKRYLKSEQQKALQPSRKRNNNNKRPTQFELLARALDTEEGNLVDHRDYLMLEEEKRRMRNKRDQVTVSGPLLRWVSKVEEVKVEVLEEKGKGKEANPADAASTSGYMYNPYLDTQHSASTYGGYGYTSTSTSIVHSGSASNTLPPIASTPTTPISTSVSPNWTLTPSNFPSAYSPITTVSSAQITQQSSPSSAPFSHQITTTLTPGPSLALVPSTSVPVSTPLLAAVSEPKQPEPKKYKTEKVATSYLVHELSQDEDSPKPSWEETMNAMFGDHVKWGELRVYTAKNRPLSRYIPTCPITGLPAKYLDPHTGVPFANLRAYKMLRSLRKELLGPGSVDNQHSAADDNDDNDVSVWDEELGCYIGEFESAFHIDESEVEKGNSGDPIVIDIT